MQNERLEEIKRLKALADVGFLYSTNDYDKERYCELREISLRLLSIESGISTHTLKENFSVVKDYPTVKVDVRGVVLSADKKILLVKETNDGKWSLPGGWADIGYSPKEIIIKECKEETGLEISPKALLAVFDKRLHLHPPQVEYVYKLVFYCEVISSDIKKGFDILDVQFFPIDGLPALSENRILKSQIELLYGKIMADDFVTYLD
ncbi:MAG: NUDIX hydrolase [Bacteroidota bacterium]|nr:NUDIX hydrolase [Bacteroidota bacterium]